MNEPDHRRTSVLTTPIHIYVLWHPQFAEGQDLATDIYRWFRLDNIEGIPVFFRSPDARGSDRPPEIQRKANINYVIPLVDAHMVADPAWRKWLVALSTPNATTAEDDPTLFDQRLFPVAMDEFAFQLPAELRGLNFIRHDITRQPAPVLDALLGVLTEVMCRDLRYRLHPVQAPPSGSREPQHGPPPSKIKIFLSHAKADGTEVARRLKGYIQSQTQCETFFDETDIPSGREYREVLENAIRSDSAGMIVIHGSQYAERPWCRREIRTFQKPRPDPAMPPGSQVRSFFVPPVMVVEDMGGDRVSRSIPELGFAPAMRWSEGAERRIVNTLLREVLLGFFHRLLIRNGAKHRGLEPGDILVNRPPDPLLVQRLVQEARDSRGTPPAGWGQQGPAPVAKRVFYPGYGLSQMEKAMIEATFDGVQFRPLAELDAMPAPLEALAGEVVRLSVGDAPDTLDAGYGDQHNQELVIRLFRPLAKAGASILHGGMMPKAASALSAWEIHPHTRKRFVNFTSTCVHILVAERNHLGDGTDGCQAANDPMPRRYSMPTWPESEKVTPRTISQWVDVCTFAPVTPGNLPPTKPARPIPASSGLKPMPEPPDPAWSRSDFDSAEAFHRARQGWEAQVQDAKDHNAVVAACCLTWMRRAVCGETGFPNMDPHRGGEATVPVKPIAHVFIGGKLGQWSGIAPGIFEEFAAAARARQPIFLVGAGQGASGAIARWLRSAVKEPKGTSKPTPARPPEFTEDTCRRGARDARLARTFAQWKRDGRLPKEQWGLKEILDAIHDVVAEARGAAAQANLQAVLNNGLTHEQNLVLLDPATGHGTICKWIHQGLLNIKKGQPTLQARRARPAR